jgi:hypothetical protein
MVPGDLDQGAALDEESRIRLVSTISPGRRLGIATTLDRIVQWFRSSSYAADLRTHPRGAPAANLWACSQSRASLMVSLTFSAAFFTLAFA